MYITYIIFSGENHDTNTNLSYRRKKKAIKKLSDERGTTQSNIIREAIDEYVEKKEKEPKKKSINDFAGIWKDKEDIPDVDKLRDEWENRLKEIHRDR